MSTPPKWLPDAARLSDFGGNWDKYLAAIYEIFERDFKRSRPSFDSRPVVYDSRIEFGKEATFWHITSTENPATKDRIPDLRRCERIAWIRAIIEHYDDKVVSWWKNKRQRETRVLMWLENMDFLVILAEKPRVMVLITTYYTDREHTRRRLRKERDRYSQIQKTPS